MSIISWILNQFKAPCSCCGTTEGVNGHGYTDAKYCNPCAKANGYQIFTAEQLKCHCK